MTCPYCGKPYEPGMSVMNHLVSKAALFTKTTVEEIRGPVRLKDLVRVRHAVCLAARRKGIHLKQIGTGLGNRDHSTVVYGLKIAERRTKTDPDFRLLVKDLEASI